MVWFIHVCVYRDFSLWIFRSFLYLGSCDGAILLLSVGFMWSCSSSGNGEKLIIAKPNPNGDLPILSVQDRRNKPYRGRTLSHSYPTLHLKETEDSDPISLVRKRLFQFRNSGQKKRSIYSLSREFRWHKESQSPLYFQEKVHAISLCRRRNLKHRDGAQFNAHEGDHRKRNLLSIHMVHHLRYLWKGGINSFSICQG